MTTVDNNFTPENSNQATPGLVKASSSQASQSNQRAVENKLDALDALVQVGLDEATIELSIVMPCLNEADTLATCIEKCNRVIQEHNLSAEVIIADNGSTDGSIEIAQSLGARVVHVKERATVMHSREELPQRSESM